MLTRRPSLHATAPAETAELIRREDPLPPGRLYLQVPRKLETICLTCLRKEPQNRYASALELAEDLRCFLVEQPIKARPMSIPERVWRWSRQRPIVASILAGSTPAGLFAAAFTVRRLSRMHA